MKIRRMRTMTYDQSEDVAAIEYELWEADDPENCEAGVRTHNALHLAPKYPTTGPFTIAGIDYWAVVHPDAVASLAAWEAVHPPEVI